MGKMRTLCLSTALAVAGTIMLTGSAHAATISYDCVSNNDVLSCGQLEAQIFADVTYDDGTELVTFRFYNTGPEASSVSEIYFSEDGVLEYDSHTNGTGVEFEAVLEPFSGSNNCNPPEPGGGIVWSKTFCAEATPPAASNGINPNEQLWLNFTLTEGNTFANLLAGLENNSIKTALHVIAFDNGESEWGTGDCQGDCGGGDPVPEPTTMLLMGMGLVAGVTARRRTKK